MAPVTANKVAARANEDIQMSLIRFLLRGQGQVSAAPATSTLRRDGGWGSITKQGSHGKGLLR
jgi:hypothetical protein